MNDYYIELTQGKRAIVDAEDCVRLSELRWHARFVKGGWYAATTRPFGTRKLLMHRFILGVPDGVHVDHANGDGLDNRKANLRACNASQNTANSHVARDSRSGYKGVTFCPSYRSKPWLARIGGGGEEYLGYYATKQEAAAAYDAKAREMFGQFARLNFPKAGEFSAKRTRPAHLPHSAECNTCEPVLNYD